MHDTITSSGQIWDIGSHALLCADAGKSSLVSDFMGKDSARMLLTSPPYLQQRDYLNPIGNWDALMQSVFSNLHMTADAQILVNLGIVHQNGSIICYWNSFLEWMQKHDWKLFDWYVWDKVVPMLGASSGHLLASHEWLFHFNKKIIQAKKIFPCAHAGTFMAKGKGRKYDLVNSKQRICNQLYNKDVIVNQMRVPNSVIRIPKQCNRIFQGLDHPAVFPIRFPQFLIPLWTDRGDIVYDPFSGSGSVIIACQNTNRICRAIEISPYFCDITLLRFHILFHGIPITLRDTGQNFADFPATKRELAKIASLRYNSTTQKNTEQQCFLQIN